MKNVGCYIMATVLLCAVTMCPVNGDTVVVGKEGVATMNPKEATAEEPSLFQRVGQYVEDKFGGGSGSDETVTGRSPVYGGETLQAAKDNATALSQRVADSAATGAAYVREKGSDLADAIRRGVGLGGSTVLCAENDVSWGATYIKDGVEYMKDKITGVATRVGDATRSGTDYIQDKGSELAQTAGDQLQTGASTIKDTGSGVVHGAGEAIRSGATAVKDTFIGGVDTARAAVGSVGEAVMGGVDAAGRLVQGTGEGIRSGGASIHDRLHSTADDTADYAKSTAESAEDRARRGATSGQTTGRNAAYKAGDTVHGAGSTLKEKGQESESGSTGILGKVRDAVEALRQEL